MRRAACLFLAAVMVSSFFGCAPHAESETPPVSGAYRAEGLIYLSTKHALYPRGAYSSYYFFEDESLTCTDISDEESGELITESVSYKVEEITPSEFRSDFSSGVGMPNPDGFESIRRVKLNDFKRLYLLDNKIWLAEVSEGKNLQIVSLVPQAGRDY